MASNLILIIFLWFAISSIVISHFIQHNDVNELSTSDIKFNNDNITYYSYHIHVYFSQRSLKQQKEAIVLRNRFLAEFNTSDCNNHCDTWCPRICHWNLNLSPLGYDLHLLFSRD
jgi:hypothetical protein